MVKGVKRAFAALLFLGVAIHAGAEAAQLFGNGERWLAVGDSITHNGEFTAWVYLYYATRFPERDLEVENGGRTASARCW